MSVLSADLLRALAADPNLWPGDLSNEVRSEARVRLEATLAGQPGDVRAEIVETMTDPARNAWARAAFAGLTMARTAGSRAVGLVAPGCIRMEDASGDAWALGVLTFSMEEHPAGEPADLRRLVGALDATFAERRYGIYLRRAVPSAFDPAPIARAVHLWLGAIDRGEWQGHHAIYEDKDVALELTLTGDRGRGVSNRIFMVGPITSLERLSGVDAQLVRQTVAYQDELGDLPVATVLAANQPWRMPRGYVEQLLYGTADFIRAGGDRDASYTAGFSANGRSLFSDPACRNLVGLWWVEPAQAAHALAFRAWVHDNPWSIHGDRVPAVNGRRFAVRERDAVGARGRRSAVLSWQGAAELLWEVDG